MQMADDRSQDEPAEQLPETLVTPDEGEAKQEEVVEEKEETPPPAEDEVVEYEPFKMTEGFELHESANTAFVEAAKAAKMDQKSAQSMLDVATKEMQRQQSAREEEITGLLKKQNEQWVEAIKSDKEFGGDEYDNTIMMARKSLDQFGDDELKTYLANSGAGNNPAIIKLLARIEKQYGEKPIVDGEGGIPIEDAANALLDNTPD